MPTDAAPPTPAGTRPRTSPVTSVTPVPLVPAPRTPLAPTSTENDLRGWYENELGWETVPGEPVRLITGRRFDVLDVPAEAGRAALGRLPLDSPVAVRGDRMWLLVAAGCADEVPGILEWLEWGALALDLAAVGAGGVIEAPRAVRSRSGGCSGVSAAARKAVGAEPAGREAARPTAAGGTAAAVAIAAGTAQGAAVWVRPPVAGREVESSLPTMPSLSAMSAPGGGGGAPDLVRLMDTVATQCHRVRLRHAAAQPIAFS